MADGVHQVGLAQPGTAVDDQRVEHLARSLGGRPGRRVGQPIGRADDEVVEGVLRVETAALQDLAVEVAVAAGVRVGPGHERTDPLTAVELLVRPLVVELVIGRLRRLQRQLGDVEGDVRVDGDGQPGHVPEAVRQCLLDPGAQPVLQLVARVLVRDGHHHGVLDHGQRLGVAQQAAMSGSGVLHDVGPGLGQLVSGEPRVFGGAPSHACPSCPRCGPAGAASTHLSTGVDNRSRPA
ncbi:hypothetical protein SDC9_63088 [bioreactor metagenome]|uniref:Uncharacterized protein n=1 Tax=bioreactor metagenome TaxID=1076179 RepID=A0A644XL73_9ZZZZ